MQKLNFHIIILIAFSLTGYSQSTSYRFTHFEKVFEEGIYLNFEQFKKQKPVGIHQIIAMEKKSDPDFINKILSYDKFSFFDPYGQILTLNTNSIWGITHRNSLYLWHEKLLCKVHFTGRWGYFTSYKTNQAPGASISPGGYYAMQIPVNTARNATSKIIDLKTGEITPLKRKSIQTILEYDSLLFNEYNSLSRRKQKQLKFLYIRKLNDKIPFEFLTKDSN